MPRFKKTERLPHEWASLALHLHKYQRAQSQPEMAQEGERTLAHLTFLMAEFGDELRDAIRIVSQAEGEVNTHRSQQIAQFHRNRIGKLSRTLEQLDDELAQTSDAAANPLEVVELTSQRTDLEYQLKHHSEKVDRRSHGLHLTKMRRRSRLR